MAKVIIGQEDVIMAALYALFSRGHCLLVGVPGLAKTLLVQTLAHSLELGFGRIQFTPDLMPSDITGTEILEEDSTTGHRRFVFGHGPVFTQILLADEINRTPPKTQAALLEAMQEKKVVEQHSFTPLERIQPVLTREEVLSFRQAIAQVPAAPNVIEYAVRLVRATRPVSNGEAPDYIKRWIRWGASPRASQYLILAGRARAACEGRFNVACEDVAALAPLVLRHRLIRTFQADAEGKTTDDIIAQLLQDVPRE